VAKSPTILVFDSGLGGLTVFREIVKARPDASYVYVADDAFFPYGSHGEAPTGCARRAADGGADRRPCARPRSDRLNTASTLVLPSFAGAPRGAVRRHRAAIKPACVASRSRLVSVLGTEATVQREYTPAP